MTDAITFTLETIRTHRPCEDSWKALCKSLGGINGYGKDTPITMRQIYESNGYDDVFWCLRITPPETHYLWRHFAVDCAKMVEHLMEDGRSKHVLEVARKHALYAATDEELAAAAMATATDAARDAAKAAAWGTAKIAAKAAAKATATDAAKAAQINLLEIYCRDGARPENSEALLKQFYEKELARI